MTRKIWVLTNLCVVCLTVRLKLIFRMFGPLCCSLLFFLFCIQMSSFVWFTRARHTYKWIHIFAIQYHVQYTLRDIHPSLRLYACLLYCILLCTPCADILSWHEYRVEMKWKCHEANERIWCENWKRNKIICSFVRCLLSFHLNQSKHISKETIWLLIWMNKSLASNFNLSNDNDAKHVFVIYVSNNYTSIILFHLWIFRALYFIRKNRFEYAKNIES